MASLQPSNSRRDDQTATHINKAPFFSCRYEPLNQHTKVTCWQGLLCVRALGALGGTAGPQSLPSPCPWPQGPLQASTAAPHQTCAAMGWQPAPILAHPHPLEGPMPGAVPAALLLALRTALSAPWDPNSSWPAGSSHLHSAEMWWSIIITKLKSKQTKSCPQLSLTAIKYECNWEQEISTRQMVGETDFCKVCSLAVGKERQSCCHTHLIFCTTVLIAHSDADVQYHRAIKETTGRKEKALSLLLNK